MQKRGYFKTSTEDTQFTRKRYISIMLPRMDVRQRLYAD